MDLIVFRSGCEVQEFNFFKAYDMLTLKYSVLCSVLYSVLYSLFYLVAANQPELWNKLQVTNWISEICQSFEIEEDEVSDLKGQNGKALDSLPKEDWIRRSKHGDLFYNEWQKLKGSEHKQKEEGKSSGETSNETSKQRHIHHSLLFFLFLFFSLFLVFWVLFSLYLF